MRAKTQKYISTEVHPINRQCRVYHLDLHTPRLVDKWYVHWISAGTKSLAQNAGDFVLFDGTFTEVHPN